MRTYELSLNEDGKTARIAILLAIRPEFAEAILSGAKVYELRKVTPKAKPPFIVFLYVTKPDMAIVGFFSSSRVVATSIRRLWAIAGEKSALTKTEFLEYFENREKGCALKVESPSPLSEPLSISRIREFDPEYSPPQSMQYLMRDHPVVKALKEIDEWPRY